MLEIIYCKALLCMYVHVCMYVCMYVYMYVCTKKISSTDELKLYNTSEVEYN